MTTWKAVDLRHRAGQALRPYKAYGIEVVWGRKLYPGEGRRYGWHLTFIREVNGQEQTYHEFLGRSFAKAVSRLDKATGRG